MENMKREESAITLEEIKSKNGDNDEAAIENRVATYHFGLKRYRAQENGDCGYDAAVLPKWFNEEMFERAKILARKHFMALMFTHLCGLYLLVFMKPIFNVLASTGQSKNISCLFRRYFRTLKHVKIWYEGNVWDFHDDASKSIAMVRAMHKQVAHKCNKNNSREEVFISQRDMVYTQFAFIGLLILYPRRFGFTLNEYDLKCIVHFWACIGYLLGIDDKCNLFASENLLEIRSICDRILDDMKCYASEEQSEEMKRMADGIIIGVNTFVPCLRPQSFRRFLFEAIEMKTVENLDFLRSFFYQMMRVFFYYLIHFTLIAIVCNSLLRYSLYRTSFKIELIAERLNYV